MRGSQTTQNFMSLDQDYEDKHLPGFTNNQNYINQLPYQKPSYDVKAILEPDLNRVVPNLGVKQEIERVTLEGINEKDTDELRRKMMLLDMHKKNLMMHEPYMETNNKRPGPALEQSNAEKDELVARRNYSWNKPHFDLTSARIQLELIDWKKVLAVHCAKSSTSGVFFASQIHGAFVIKACADVVSAFFTSKLYQRLQIPTPDVRVVGHYDKEFKFMLHSLERVSFHDDTLRYMIRIHMDRPFILLQEYIPAVSLTYMGAKRADRCFNVAYPDASNRLINLGKIIAADICVNNPDRMPMIWDNHGNSTNLLFEINTDEKIDDEKIANLDYSDFQFANSVAIDNKSFCIIQNDRAKINYLRDYLKRVESFFEAVFKDLNLIINGDVAVNDYHYPSIKRVLDFFKDHTLYEIKGRAAFRIIEGIVIGLFNIQNEGFRSTEEAKQETASAVDRDWKDVWSHGIGEIDLEFFKITMGTVEKAIAKYEEEIKWVLKTNLFSFVIDHVVEGKGSRLIQQLKEEEDRTATAFRETQSNMHPKEQSVLGEQPAI